MQYRVFCLFLFPKQPCKKKQILSKSYRPTSYCNKKLEEMSRPSRDNSRMEISPVHKSTVVIMTCLERIFGSHVAATCTSVQECIANSEIIYWVQSIVFDLCELSETKAQTYKKWVTSERISHLRNVLNEHKNAQQGVTTHNWMQRHAYVQSEVQKFTKERCAYSARVAIFRKICQVECQLSKL